MLRQRPRIDDGTGALGDADRAPDEWLSDVETQDQPRRLDSMALHGAVIRCPELDPSVVGVPAASRLTPRLHGALSWGGTISRRETPISSPSTTRIGYLLAEQRAGQLK